MKYPAPMPPTRPERGPRSPLAARSCAHRIGRAGGLALAGLVAATALAAGAEDWPSYGGDPGGQRYSTLREITPRNVSRLEVAWTHHSGDVADGSAPYHTTSAYELTPILADGTLYACTPFNRVLAIDPATGAERWSFDPEIDRTARWANQLVCRGVAYWRDPQAASGSLCAARVLTATADARLLALDAKSGRPCPGFGENGRVDLNPGVGAQRWRGEYQVTSPPAVVGDLVVVGAAVADNQRTDAPSGVVRGFDARSGALRWAWDLAPPDAPADAPRAEGTGWMLGTPNVWAPISVDEARGLVFVPTGNPSPDYWRGEARHDFYGSSVVALRADTGAVAWHFQTVHHDLWDYDVPAQPTLTVLRRQPGPVPAVIQATKMGLLFVLHRETGIPLFPVEERPVPQAGAPGERLSPTQPFPAAPPPLVPHRIDPADAWGLTPWDSGDCREQLTSLRNDGIYTPPTVQGSIMLPGNAGGSNWGGVAVDPDRQLLLANTINAAWAVRLIPRADFAAAKAAEPGLEISPQEGTPFGMRRVLLVSPLGLPCSPPPWGTLAAIDLGSGAIRWQVPLGTVRDIAPVPIPWRAGTPNLGGPLVTASGLVFIGAAMDDYLRAFDVETGEELWTGRLPAGGQATPMTYRVGGRQYVVIAAGGHGRMTTTLGDALVAFALPE